MEKRRKNAGKINDFLTKKTGKMALKSITISRINKKVNGQSITEIGMEIEMENEIQKPTQSEALELLAEGIKIIVEHSKSNSRKISEN